MKEAREPLVDKPIGHETLSMFEELSEVVFNGDNRSLVIDSKK